jgi:CheY-like chemotaxis protein
VDVDAFGGTLHALALAILGDGPDARRRLVVATRLQAMSVRPDGSGGRLIKPIKVRTLVDVIRAAIDQAASQTTPVSARRTRDKGPASILLVEDNEANRRVVEMMITELGLQADSVSSGCEAVQAAARKRYDVILMDVQMSDMDGLEAAQRIRAAEWGPPVRIIALTANVMEGDEARCREAGMDGYLAKPLRLDSLATALLDPVAARSFINRA